MSDNRKPVWRRIIKYVVFILIIVAALIGLNMFFSSRTVETYTPPLKNVVTAEAEMRDIKESVTVSSYVESQSMVPVVPFVSGTIEEYNIEAGDKVEEGDVIAVIDKEPYELQVAQAEAALSAYSSSYERLIRLQEAGAATQQDIDTVKAQLDAAQAQEELAQLQLSYTDVTAPVAGSIIMASSSKGSPAGSQSPVAVIADTSALVVNAEVSERYYSILTSNRDNLTLTVYDRPANLFVADFVGNPTMNFFPVKAERKDSRSFAFHMLGRDLVFTGEKDIAEETADAVIGVRPEFITLGEGAFKGVVYTTLPSGMETTVRIRRGDDFVTAVVFGSVDFSHSLEMPFGIKGNGILLFDKASGKMLSVGAVSEA